MKKLLYLLSFIIVSNILHAQTTVVQSIQVKTATGAPPITTMPSNGGIAYYDATGIIKKAEIKALLGKKIDSVTRLNDSTMQFVSQYGNTYNVTLRGLYDLSTKGFVDSLRNGTKKDTSVIKNIGTGLTKIASTSIGADTQFISTFKDSTEIKFIQNGDGTVLGYIGLISGAAAGTYGDATHVPQIVTDAKGKIVSITPVTITGTGGSTPKKTLNAQNSNYTLIATDTLKYITVNSAIQDTIKIPDDVTAVMGAPVNLDIYQLGSGKVLFAPLNGSITLNAKFGKLRSAGQYSKVVLNKLSANNWILSGDLDTTTAPFLNTSVTILNPQNTTTGIASLPDSFTVSGFYLTAGATVTPPNANFEVSLDNVSYASSKSISLSGTSLASQPVKVYARSTSTASAGTNTGNVTVASTGATSVTLAISGTVISGGAKGVDTIMSGSVANAAFMPINIASFTANYRVIKVFFYDIIPVTSGTSLLAQVSADGTTYDGGAANYTWFWSSPTTPTANSTSATSATIVGTTGGMLNSTGMSTSGKLEFMNPNSTGKQPQAKGWVNVGNNSDLKFAFTRLNPQAFKGLRFFASSGNISGKYLVTGIH